MHICFPFHHGTCISERFLNSTFVISPRKKAPTSHNYSLQHVENGREKNYVIRVYEQLLNNSHGN